MDDIVGKNLKNALDSISVQLRQAKESGHQYYVLDIKFKNGYSLSRPPFVSNEAIFALKDAVTTVEVQKMGFDD